MIAAAKATARQAAFARRRTAFEGAGARQADLLAQVLAEHEGRPLAGYAPIRTEIDPTVAMTAHSGPVGLPVIDGPGLPLRFRIWTLGCDMVDGPFGARVPASGAWMRPEILIVPLVAFDRAGGRLGYGGGFYDRTLAILRAAAPTIAIGFAFAAQEATDLPQEPTDQSLDMIVTETEIIASPSRMR